jgi:hypothetical protein
LDFLPARIFWNFSQLLAISFELFSFGIVFNLGIICHGVPPVGLLLSASGPTRQSFVFVWRHATRRGSAATCPCPRLKGQRPNRDGPNAVDRSPPRAPARQRQSEAATAVSPFALRAAGEVPRRLSPYRHTHFFPPPSPFLFPTQDSAGGRSPPPSTPRARQCHLPCVSEVYAMLSPCVAHPRHREVPRYFLLHVMSRCRAVVPVRAPGPCAWATSHTGSRAVVRWAAAPEQDWATQAMCWLRQWSAGTAVQAGREMGRDGFDPMAFELFFSIF